MTRAIHQAGAISNTVGYISFPLNLYPGKGKTKICTKLINSQEIIKAAEKVSVIAKCDYIYALTLQPQERQL